MLMGQSYQHNKNTYSLIKYHFIFCTKRKKKILVGNILKRTKQLFNRVVKIIDCKIISMEIMPNHVHLFVNCNPFMASNQIVYKIKNYSSKHLRKEFPELLKIPGTWTNNYFVSTADNISSETSRKYIETQSKQ